MVDKIQYVSPEGLDKLKRELQELKSVRRKEAVVKIEAAKALGDLSENADYHEAKNELAFIDGRIQEINETMKNISIIEEGSSSVARIGSTLVAESKGTQKTFRIVGSNEADPTQGLISNESPLGSAFLGHTKGERVDVTTPAGTQTYKIVSVS
jgi:transcription elongation factor GreA